MSAQELLAYWPAAAGAVGSFGLGGMFKAWLDHRRGVRKDSDNVAMELVQSLSDRVRVLEATLANKDALYDATMAVMRHRMNNLNQCFDALLLLIEADPKRAGEFVARIKEMRAKQEIEEAAEKAAIQAARISATAEAHAPYSHAEHGLPVGGTP